MEKNLTKHWGGGVKYDYVICYLDSIMYNLRHLMLHLVFCIVFRQTIQLS